MHFRWEGEPFQAKYSFSEGIKNPWLIIWPGVFLIDLRLICRNFTIFRAGGDDDFFYGEETVAKGDNPFPDRRDAQKEEQCGQDGKQERFEDIPGQGGEIAFYKPGKMKDSQGSGNIYQAVQPLPIFTQPNHGFFGRCHGKQKEYGKGCQPGDNIAFFNRIAEQFCPIEPVIQPGKTDYVQKGIREGIQSQRPAQFDDGSVPGKRVERRAGKGKHQKNDGQLSGPGGDFLGRVKSKIVPQVIEYQDCQGDPGKHMDRQLQFGEIKIPLEPVFHDAQYSI